MGGGLCHPGPGAAHGGCHQAKAAWERFYFIFLKILRYLPLGDFTLKP